MFAARRNSFSLRQIQGHSRAIEVPLAEEKLRFEVIFLGCLLESSDRFCFVSLYANPF